MANRSNRTVPVPEDDMTTVLDAPGDQTHVSRYSFRQTGDQVTLHPALADRPVVSRPEHLLFVPPAELVTLYLSTAVWIRVELAKSGRLLREMPSYRMSDTWFGASTVDGEFCYATRTAGRLQLEHLPRRLHRAVTPLRIKNTGTDALALERVQLPIEYLALYTTSTHELWTQAVTMTRSERDQGAGVQIRSGPPADADEAEPPGTPAKVTREASSPARSAPWEPSSDLEAPLPSHLLPHRRSHRFIEQWWTVAVDYLTSPQAAALLRAAVKIAVGLVLGRLAGNGLARLFAEEDAQRAMIIRRASFYGIAGLFVASALMELGFNLSVLLGAAGILTVAIGFASQTSASNVISGLFLLGERPFAVGDIIRVGGTTGEVLSVKLRTFDNLFVRIPNETMIKSEVTNLRRFPIRRIDLQVGVAYKEEVLLEVADRNPLCLEEPAPSVLFDGFADSSMNYQFRVWAKTENFLDLRNSIPIEIKEAFDEHGIEIPFPHRTLYTGSETDPFPVRSTSAPPDAPSAPSDAPAETEQT